MTATTRRTFLRYSLAGLGVLALSPLMKAGKALAAGVEKLTKTDAEWRKILTPDQFAVLREEATEQPFTSELLHEKRTGIFSCVACDLPLFDSAHKYDSGTGWPSFWQAIEGHIETKTDYKAVIPRTEFHCARCEGHHGHVFNDGPEPTGLRHCCNGIVLKFTEKA